MINNVREVISLLGGLQKYSKDAEHLQSLLSKHYLAERYDSGEETLLKRGEIEARLNDLCDNVINCDKNKSSCYIAERILQELT